MKKYLFMLIVAVAAAFNVSCSNEQVVDAGTPGTRAGSSITLSGVLKGDQDLTAYGTVYLNGKVYQTDGTIKFAAGTEIIGQPEPTTKEASALIITPTGKIDAQGSSSSPIIFKGTSDKKGSWGGLVLLGKAIINQPDSQLIEGIDPASVPDGVNVFYGTPKSKVTESEAAALDATSSGILKYVRVENAGASISKDNELNAFTFGAVGSGTVVEHIQAYHGADDGAEFFGGAVNVKYYVCTATDDDGLDFDFGYHGKIQFAVITEDPTLNYSSDPNGIECDNEKPFVATHQPYTHPVLSNLTIVGTTDGKYGTTPFKSAANFRRGTEFTLVNSIIYGFPKGLYFTDEPQSQLDNSIFANNIIASYPAGNELVSDAASGKVKELDITKVDSVDEIGLVNPWTLTGLIPGQDSKATDGNYYTKLDVWFTKVAFKGAANDNRANWLDDKWIRKDTSVVK